MSAAAEVEVGGRVVRITNPDRVYFPARGETKLDLVNYYLRPALPTSWGRSGSSSPGTTGTPTSCA
jgi:hypothetical protein